MSVVMVAHNEEADLEAKLRNCLELDYPRSRLEVVVVSDGSSDGTDAIAARFAGDGVRLLRLPGPRGKAAALGQAVPLCGGEILVLCDTRQRLAADAVGELVAHGGRGQRGAAHIVGLRLRRGRGGRTPS